MYYNEIVLIKAYHLICILSYFNLTIIKILSKIMRKKSPNGSYQKASFSHLLPG